MLLYLRPSRVSFHRQAETFVHLQCRFHFDKPCLPLCRSLRARNKISLTCGLLRDRRVDIPLPVPGAWSFSPSTACSHATDTAVSRQVMDPGSFDELLGASCKACKNSACWSCSSELSLLPRQSLSNAGLHQHTDLPLLSTTTTGVSSDDSKSTAVASRRPPSSSAILPVIPPSTAAYKA